MRRNVNVSDSQQLSNQKLLSAFSLDAVKNALNGAPPANINAVDSSGRTALYNAVSLSRLEVAKYLLSRGADATIAPRYVRSVYDAAKGSGNAELVALIEQALGSHRVVATGAGAGAGAGIGAGAATNVRLFDGKPVAGAAEVVMNDGKPACRV